MFPVEDISAILFLNRVRRPTRPTPVLTPVLSSAVRYVSVKEANIERYEMLVPEIALFGHHNNKQVIGNPGQPVVTASAQISNNKNDLFGYHSDLHVSTGHRNPETATIATNGDIEDATDSSKQAWYTTEDARFFIVVAVLTIHSVGFLC